MDTQLIICAVVCGIIGILGAVLPILPGTIISYAGLVCAFLASDTTITTGQLWLWGALSAVVILLDYILPGYFSKVFGGSKAGITGATVGIFAGLFMGPLGIIFGPFVGAVAGEMLSQQRPFEEALKVGFGSMLSFLVGTGFKLIVGGFIFYYIVLDLIHRF